MLNNNAMSLIEHKCVIFWFDLKTKFLYYIHKFDEAFLKIVFDIFSCVLKYIDSVQ